MNVDSKSTAVVASSFHDRSGFVFERDGTVYRQVNEVFSEQYDMVTSSGLYQALVERGVLVSHEEAANEYAISPAAYTVIRPEQLRFISYPYEWYFGQLKDAALTTLGIQKTALEYGMSLKDSSAYNVQFKGSRRCSSPQNTSRSPPKTNLVYV